MSSYHFDEQPTWLERMRWEREAEAERREREADELRRKDLAELAKREKEASLPAYAQNTLALLRAKHSHKDFSDAIDKTVNAIRAGEPERMQPLASMDAYGRYDQLKLTAQAITEYGNSSYVRLYGAQEPAPGAVDAIIDFLLAPSPLRVINYTFLRKLSAHYPGMDMPIGRNCAYDMLKQAIWEYQQTATTVQGEARRSYSGEY